MLFTRLCTRNTCPPLSISRKIASRTSDSSYSEMVVFIGNLSSGGVSMVLISLTPDSDMYSVRGMGVAVRVSTSTCRRSFLRCSLCATPNLCSSSMMTSPRFLNPTSRCSRRWVPMTISTVPRLSPAITSSCSRGLRKRLSTDTFTGKAARRSVKVWKCCCASTVVGTSTAACAPSSTALNAARRATSVLP